MPTENAKVTVTICAGTHQEKSLIIPGIAAINGIEREIPDNPKLSGSYGFSVVMQGLQQSIHFGGFEKREAAQLEIDRIKDASQAWYNALPCNRE